MPANSCKQFSCLRGCHNQLCQMLRTGKAVITRIHVICQDPKAYHLQFFEVMSLYDGEVVMQIERCREDCYVLSNLQATREQLSPDVLRWKRNLTQVNTFPICLWLKNIFYQRPNNISLHISLKYARQYWSVNDMGELWQNQDIQAEEMLVWNPWCRR